MAILFWMVFLIVILLLFIINLPLIRSTLRSTRLVERLTNTPVEAVPETEAPPPDAEEPPASQIFIAPPAQAAEQPPAETPGTAAAPDGVDAVSAQETPPVSTETGRTPIEESMPAARERVIYFVKIDNSGMVLTSPVKRQVFVSDSPMLDALKLLLQGPTGSEENQGLTSLIPDGVRIQNAHVTGSTAVISFNENFMFNEYGAEGYIAQLRQIVWTATEFPNVRDVQILIEGRRIDFLGESIRIGRPIGRDDL
ncbi:MAG: GerMN domain-containing protein [Spirochaetaceae bacterium]|nr:GerMN domain-containing protein [Spirochaetaceae bacterium]